MAVNKGKIGIVTLGESSRVQTYLKEVVSRVDLLQFTGSFNRHEQYMEEVPRSDREQNKIALVQCKPREFSTISRKIKGDNENTKILYIASEWDQNRKEGSMGFNLAELNESVNNNLVDGIFSTSEFTGGLIGGTGFSSFNEYILKKKVLKFIQDREIRRDLSFLILGGGKLANGIARELFSKSYCKSLGWYSEFNPNIGEMIDHLHGIPNCGEKIFPVKDLGEYIQSKDPDIIFIARGARSTEIDFSQPRKEINTVITTKSCPILDRTYQVLREVKPNGLKAVFTNLPGPWLYEGSKQLGAHTRWTSFSSDSDRLRRIIYDTLVEKNTALRDSLKLESIFVPVLGEHGDELAIHWENATINNQTLEEATKEMGLPKFNLQYFINHDQEFTNRTVEFGNLIKMTARKTQNNDYDVASCVERYVSELAFFSATSKMPWYSYINYEALKSLRPYAPGFSLEGAYLMFPARIEHHPTIKINRSGSDSLKDLPERMKVRLGRALLRQNKLVDAINSAH